MGYNTKQMDLRVAGMDLKEIENLSVDRRKNQDLAVLTSQGGPFTTAEQVDKFM